MINRKEHLTLSGVDQIRAIKAGINSNRSHTDKANYMASIANSLEITAGWLSGFMAGDGHIGVYFHKISFMPKASFGQNNHDEVLLLAIARYLNLTIRLTGNRNLTKGETFVLQLSINGYTNPAVSRLIEILTEFPLFTTKRSDFELYKIVVEIMNKGEHRNELGYSTIKALILRQQSRRRRVYKLILENPRRVYREILSLYIIVELWSRMNGYIKLQLSPKWT